MKLPSEAMETPSTEVLKTHVEKALGNLLQQMLLWVGWGDGTGDDYKPPEVLLNPDYSVIL